MCWCPSRHCDIFAEGRVILTRYFSPPPEGRGSLLEDTIRGFFLAGMLTQVRLAFSGQVSALCLFDCAEVAS